MEDLISTEKPLAIKNLTEHLTTMWYDLYSYRLAEWFGSLYGLIQDIEKWTVKFQPKPFDKILTELRSSSWIKQKVLAKKLNEFSQTYTLNQQQAINLSTSVAWKVHSTTDAIQILATKLKNRYGWESIRRFMTDHRLLITIANSWGIATMSESRNKILASLRRMDVFSDQELQLLTDPNHFNRFVHTVLR